MTPYAFRTIFLESGHISVNTFVFFDGLRYYMFCDNDLVNPLEGPGTLCFNPDTLQALYSTSISLNQNLDADIASLMSDVTEVMTEVTTTSTPSSSTPDLTTTSFTVVTQPSPLPPGTPSTTLPPGTPSTTLPPTTANHATSLSPTSMTDTAEDPIDVCDDDCDDDSTSSNLLVLPNPDAMNTLPERKPRIVRRAGRPRKEPLEGLVVVRVVFQIEKIHVRIVKVILEVDI